MAILYLTAMMAGIITAPWHLTLPSSPVHMDVLATAVHNLEVIAIIFFGGIGLALPTVVVGGWNGYLTGYLLAEVAGRPNWLLGILAHGIPEATAQWCAMVGGMEFFLWLWRLLRGSPGSIPVRALSWGGVAVLGTCLAALIEGTMSPVVVELLAP